MAQTMETQENQNTENKSGLEEMFAKYMKYVDVNDAYVQGIVAAVIVVLFSTLMLLLVRRSRSQRQKVLILGLCNAGKTCMFSWLVYQKNVMTQTSIKENENVYKTSKKRLLQLLDLPGHEILRQQALDEHKLQTRGIIFVLDSQTLTKEVRDVADYLYTILTDHVIYKLKIPILIACNKQDTTLSKSSKVIRSQLEKELETVRVTKAAALSSTSGGGADTAGGGGGYLGRCGGPGTDLTFATMAGGGGGGGSGKKRPQLISFGECSSSTNRNLLQLDDVRAWLDRL